MSIAEQLRALRLEKGITQKELADSVGIAVQSIINYENGRREPNSKAMVALERYFNVSGEYLRGDADRATFLSKSEDIQEDLDELIALFLRFKTEFSTSAQDEQLLAVAVLEATVDLLSRHVLHAGRPLDLTEEEVLRPLSAVFQLNADGRAELVKRAAELTELSRYKA